MTGVVGVTDAAHNIPSVTAEQLPFIGHPGAASLPATTVLAVLPTVALNGNAAVTAHVQGGRDESAKEGRRPFGAARSRRTPPWTRNEVGAR